MDAALATRLLTSMGWKPTAATLPAVISEFQRGWHLGPPLAIDGKLGPKTKAALQVSLDRRHAGKPDMSANFSAKEFLCKCGGKYKGCVRIRIHRALLSGLEQYRLTVGNVAVVSGYRCPQHNAAVGGATSSQHVYGAAADVEPVSLYGAVAKLRRFSGIGYQKASKKVRHVDVRHLSGNNTTGGTPDRPTMWVYGA
jgi:hypothetical protein